MTNEEILELVKEESTPIGVLEKIVAKYPKFPYGLGSNEEVIEWLSYHPNSSADILDKIFRLGKYYYNIEIVNHSNTSIKTLKALRQSHDEDIAKGAKKQLKKRGVKTKKHPLRGKTIYVVMYSNSDGCDSYVYADSEHADIKESQLEKELGDDPGYVWQQSQTIK